MFTTSQNLVDEYFDMIFSQLLWRNYDLMQIRFHQITQNQTTVGKVQAGVDVSLKCCFSVIGSH